MLVLFLKHLGAENVQVGSPPAVGGQSGFGADSIQELAAAPVAVASHLGQQQADVEPFMEQPDQVAYIESQG